jgi:hypothetical protein
LGVSAQSIDNAVKADADGKLMAVSLECAVLAQGMGERMQDEALRLARVGLAIALEIGASLQGTDLSSQFGSLAGC